MRNKIEREGQLGPELERDEEVEVDVGPELSRKWQKEMNRRE